MDKMKLKLLQIWTIFCKKKSCIERDDNILVTVHTFTDNQGKNTMYKNQYGFELDSEVTSKRNKIHLLWV